VGADRSIHYFLDSTVLHGSFGGHRHAGS
jgi:hypothetical protein